VEVPSKSPENKNENFLSYLETIKILKEGVTYDNRIYS
jgi:hypothetical protein